MIKFIDPLMLVIMAFNNVCRKHHLQRSATIQFSRTMKKNLWFGCWGETIFPEKASDPIVITISASLPIKDAVEIFAHELAHVCAGAEAEHNRLWDDYFSEIHSEFEMLFNRQKEKS